MKTSLLTVAFLVASAASAGAQEWGTLSGRFLFEGKTPAPVKLDINKDLEVCGKHMLVDESLVVGEDGGLANVVIYVRTKDVKVHPDYEKTATDKVVLDNKDCRFNPHVAGMRTSQTLELKNSDAVGHNTNAAAVANSPFNVLIPSNNAVPQKFAAGEIIPVKVNCNIHPWMLGYVVVRPDPYFAISGKDGKFEIKNLPAGELEFQVWQEKPGYVTKANVAGKPTEWLRGRFKTTIKAGANDLGDIKLAL